MKVKLNNNDEKLLMFCRDTRRSIREIAEHLKIAPKNVSVRLGRLDEAGLINVDTKGQGKKTFIRTTSGDKTKKHFITLLRKIKKTGGVTEEEYVKILPVNFKDMKEKDRSSATLILPLFKPKLVERRIFITPEGEKFLKENSK